MKTLKHIFLLLLVLSITLMLFACGQQEPTPAPETQQCTKHTDKDKNCKCDTCNKNLKHKDEDEDGECDKCGKELETGSSSGSKDGIVLIEDEEVLFQIVLGDDIGLAKIVIDEYVSIIEELGGDVSVWFQKRIGATFFGGEGLIMQRISGDGIVFLEIDGHCKEYTLGPGQSIVLSTGYLAAMSDTCTMDVQSVPGWKNKLFGGEGFFNTRVTGPGKVYIQSMPIANMASELVPYLPLNEDRH